MRLDKLLSNMGYGSRKEVKQSLKKGIVKVNDQIIKDGAYQVNPQQDRVVFLDEQVNYQPFIYIMMNKPPHVISATEDHHERTVIDLLDDKFRQFSPFPVGRLDKDTEGLLLLTNDGQLAHNLLSPKKEVPKTYFASIDGVVTENDVQQFLQGVTLNDGYETKPAFLTIIESADVSTVELTITEGKFHQVKRMFEAVGKRVTYLKRLSMGSLRLDPLLEKGDYRVLTEEELYRLRTIEC